MNQVLYSAGLSLLTAAHTAAGAETTKAAKTAEVWMAVLPADVLVQDSAQMGFRQETCGRYQVLDPAGGRRAGEVAIPGRGARAGAFQKLVDLCNAEKIPMFLEKGLWPQRMPDPAAERMGAWPVPLTTPMASAPPITRSPA